MATKAQANTKEKEVIDPFAKMSAFVDPEAREPVRDEYGNTVWIRQKMGLAVRGAVQKELAAIEFSLTPDGDVDMTHATAKTSPQERRHILFMHNVLDWSGPAFEKVKTYANGNERVVPIKFDTSLIELASGHPIWEAVYDRINELNDDAPAIEEDEDETLDPKAAS